MSAEDDLAKKYKDVINQQFGGDLAPEQVIRSQEFSSFKDQLRLKASSWYEKSCKFSEVLGIVPSDALSKKITDAAKLCHLKVTPKGVMGFAILFPLLMCSFGIMVTYLLWQSLFYIIIFLFTLIILVNPLIQIPMRIAKQWRLRASNQMVLATFYMVTYMRHTSNMELAISFAAEHLGPPLSTDFNSILWSVESGEYPSVKDALDVYLEDWKEDAIEFVESMHLLESSLFESEEARRLTMLDKSLEVMLEETYEKMIHYAHSLQSPITMLHMLGVVLPILGLVILPLAVNFMEGIQWFHILALYNLFLPAGVLYLGSQVLSNRPSGGGSSDDAIQNNPLLRKYQYLVVKSGKKEMLIDPKIVGITVFAFLFFIGLIPLIIHLAAPTFDFGIGGPNCNTVTGEKCYFTFLDYRPLKNTPEILLGPFGMISSLISLAFPLAIALGAGIYFKIRTEKIIELRNRSKKLEMEFGQGLFQLGNRLGDGLPVELGFGKVAEVMEGTTTGDFFSLVSNNIMQIGMGVYDAIFNPTNGALVSYPSNIIESSMKVLVESSKKGPLIAAQAVVNVSQYIKEMHRVEERLRDLMAETTSSMKSQIAFMTPAITGIVIGITSMVTTIMGNLSTQISKAGNASTISSFLSGDGIPTYYFQAVVGIYVVQVTYILTVLSNGIRNGSDKLQEEYDLGKNLIRSTLLYVAICFIIMILFNMIAGALASKAT